MASSFLNKLFYYECWTVAWRRIPDSMGYPCDGDDPEYTVVPCEGDHWEADPFLFEYGNDLFLFTEYMPLHSNHGSISVRKFSKDHFGLPDIVLRTDSHLSYPDVFSYNGRIYMIPESLNSRTVDLYECTDFPGKWEKKSTLISGRAFVDTTVHVQDGKCVLFLYDPDEPAHKEQKLYMAELDPESGTISSPVLLQTYSEKLGRPAGEPFSHNGTRVRPTQDCRKLYGGSVRYMEYELSDDGYSEKECGTLSATSVRSDLDHIPCGVHTVNRRKDIEVIDLFYRKFSIFKPFRALLARLNK